MQAAIDEVVHQTRIPEAHLVLGRVHIDIHAARIELQEQHIRRVAAVEQDIGIGLPDRVRHAAVAHRAAVDVEILLVRAGAVIGGLRDPSAQAQAGAGMVDLQGVPGEIRAQGFDQAFARKAAAQA